MTQKGTHTWDMILQYHRCPSCGRVIENREQFHIDKEKQTKEVLCPYCKHQFTLTKLSKPSFGPLFGDPQPIEWDWR